MKVIQKCYKETGFMSKSQPVYIDGSALANKLKEILGSNSSFFASTISKRNLNFPSAWNSIIYIYTVIWRIIIKYQLNMN